MGTLLRDVLDHNRARQDRRDPIQHDDQEYLDLESLPTDLMASITSLRSHMMAYPMPAACSQSPPVVLHTQLRSMLTDATVMERELDDLRRRNVIRVVKINTGRYASIM